MLDLKTPVSLYYQLELLLRREFSGPDYEPGGAIPGENELASRYGVSRVTVRRALDRLEEDGLIIRRRGARTVLSPLVSNLLDDEESHSQFRGFEEELGVGRLTPEAELLEASESEAPESVTAKLALPLQATVVRIRRLGRLGTRPLWFESRFFPLDLGRKMAQADLAHESVLTLIRAAGIDVKRVEMQLRSVQATTRQAMLLGMQAGQPLLLHESVSYIEGDRPAQFARVHLRGDMYRVTLHARPHEDMPGLQLISGGYVVTDTLTDTRGSLDPDALDK
jgi:GntR family transcriptional regulator